MPSWRRRSGSGWPAQTTLSSALPSSLRPQLAVEEGEEAAAGALVEDGGVEPLQDRRAAEALAGEQAQRVPGEAGDGGGLRARAADVADGEAVGAVADREEVVEVAADLVALAGRAVDDLDLDAGDLGQLRRQQAALEGLADGGALASRGGRCRGRGRPGGRGPRRVPGSPGGSARRTGLPRVSMPMTRLRATSGRTTVSPPTAAAVARVVPVPEAWPGGARRGRGCAWRCAGPPAWAASAGAVQTRAPGVGTGSGGAILESRALRPSMRSSSSCRT